VFWHFESRENGSLRRQRKMNLGDLVIVKPFPDYYPKFLLKESKKLIGKSGVILSLIHDEPDGFMVLIDGKILEFSKDELEEIKN